MGQHSAHAAIQRPIRASSRSLRVRSPLATARLVADRPWNNVLASAQKSLSQGISAKFGNGNITSVNKTFFRKATAIFHTTYRKQFEAQQLRALCPAQGENLYALRTTVTKTADRETVCSEPSHVAADPAKSTLLSAQKLPFSCVTLARKALTHDKSRILPAVDEAICGMPVVLVD